MNKLLIFKTPEAHYKEILGFPIIHTHMYTDIYICIHIYIYVCVLSSSVMSDSLQRYRLQPTRLLCPQGFSRQEYWRGLPCPPPGYIPNPGIKPTSSQAPALQMDSLPAEPQGKPHIYIYTHTIYTICVSDHNIKFYILKDILNIKQGK